ncbi:hypothetical protein AAF712_009619 [Marasmius tenuissimus]|uniref:Uncharacterized protein n=1 Tax=Marasmius tenuissimus TaxID=585030 RepID=A0ABR2ZT80_9AGAR
MPVFSLQWQKASSTNAPLRKSCLLPIQSNEGRVGAVFKDVEVFVTTPNAEVVFDPLRGVRSIHLRKDDHFGLEDPLFFPQPFSLACPHLALIPLPTTDLENTNFVCWHRPTTHDFEFVNREDQSGSSAGLGLFTKVLRTQLRDVVSRATDRITALRESHQSLTSDKFIQNYFTSLQWLLAQLNCACGYSRSLRTFAIIQRICLELNARITWLVDFANCWENTDAVVFVEARKPLRVVGALARNTELAQRLWSLGVPVWLVRPLGEKNPGLRVLKWIDSPDPVESLSLRTGGFRLSLEDSDPPNPVVWSGRIRLQNFDRYEMMSRELRKSATAHLYEEEEPTPASSEPPTKRQRLDPKASLAPPPPPPTTRVKFNEVQAPIMPPFLKPWRQASERVGETFNPNAHLTPLGYFMPDPQMIAVCGLESGRFDTRIAYLEVWLKLRHVLCYRLRTPTLKPMGPSRWRTVLGIEKMGFKDKKAAKQKAEVEALLVETLKSANLESTVDISRLDTASVSWKGSGISVAAASNVVLQEILWELFEIGFRYELMIMDRKFYGGKLPREEREPELLVTYLRHFNGSIVPASLGEGKEGFASTELLQRRMALWLFLVAMDEWTGAGKLPATLQRDSALWKRIDPHETAISAREVDEIEYAVALHYISCFATTFGRAPTLPHRLP